MRWLVRCSGLSVVLRDVFTDVLNDVTFAFENDSGIILEMLLRDEEYCKHVTPN